MKRRLSRLGTVVAALAVAAGAAEVVPAGAVAPTVVTCGQVITQNTTLAGDVGPCPSPGQWGIDIGANNITLDLNGYRVFGVSVPGDGAGIRVFRRSGVTIKNGAVAAFDGGVVIEGGSGHTVRNITAEDNIGLTPRSRVGDGIALLSTTGNLIERNVARRNGPFAGIGVYSLIDADHPRSTSGISSGNNIRYNEVYENVRQRNLGSPTNTGTDNDGIRLEPGTVNNSVTDNTVYGNGLDGIALFVGSGYNNISRNTVYGNGFFRTTARRGTGIQVFARANGNFIAYNTVTGNADNGINISNLSSGNRIVANRSVENRALTPISGSNWDLADRNAGGTCNHNQWIGNTYGTADPVCTTTGGTLAVP